MRERESLKLTEAAPILGISYHNLYTKCREGLIPGAFRIPGRLRSSWRITKDGIAAILENRIELRRCQDNENQA